MSTLIKNEENLSVLEVLQSQSDKQSANFPSSNIADLHTAYKGPSPYHLNYCGKECCAPGSRFGPSVRSSYLLHIVIKGKGIYYTGEKSYHLSASQAFLIYPGDTTVYCADDKDPWSYCWIGFSGYQAEYILSQMGFSGESHVVSFRDPGPLEDCISDMLLTHQITLANELARESLLLRFFSIALRQIPETAEKPLHAQSVYARVTMNYLNDHYMHRIRIADVADYIGIDRSHLTKCFRAEYKMSPQEYLVALRMRKSQELLRDTDLSVGIIAAECGYPDALAFTRMFRKYFSQSPSDYRKLSGGRFC